MIASRFVETALRLCACAACFVSLSASPIDARAAGDSLKDADEAITRLEIDRARAILAPMDANDPRVSYELGRLAMNSDDCDEAVHRLMPEPVQKVAEDAGSLLVIAKGCMRAMAGTVVVTDEAHHVVVRLQDDADAAIVPILGDTIAKQREVLKKDLGIDLPLPTRVDVVRDQFTLSAMTGLPHEAAQTTGTVAIAKFGRVIMISPRAPSLGYGILDTVAHELTHVALSRGTLDRAPLWLQEGVAKREETRWRELTPADEALPPDAIAAAGLAKGLGRPLDAIGPSIAMLPSAKEAMVVYAEVQSFVRFLAGDRAGQPGAPTDHDLLPKLVAAYDKGLDTDGALVDVTGKDLKAWNAIWRPWVSGKAGKLPPSLGLDDAPGVPMSMAFDERAAARSVRLGELLLGRAHDAAARKILDPLAVHLATDPLVSVRIALARFRLGDVSAAKSLLDPTIVTGDLGAWWALRGDVLKASGAPATEVTDAYRTAVAHDAVLAEAVCGWADALPSDPWQIVASGLCTSARARITPKLGQD